MMHGAEKSGLVIVAGKPANKAEQPAPEGSAVMSRTIPRQRYGPARVVAELRCLLDDPSYGRARCKSPNKCGMKTACSALEKLLTPQ